MLEISYVNLSEMHNWLKLLEKCIPIYFCLCVRSLEHVDRYMATEMGECVLCPYKIAIKGLIYDDYLYMIIRCH